ncbi:gastric triacylglycerol lipase [Caerostris darwini]|uniref:Gastric triacylglycerol lipase n=1 Tax=Caerostris darwini TaxID=1538125 RepID=A0AAV4RM48_9ARAC|nr:gastric triacylglycerol lipase [Caerostris darwini]
MMLGVFFAVVLLAGAYGQYVPNKLPNDARFKHDPDIFRNVSQLISSKGYPVEEYTVQTADGYLLGVQRIPHGRNGPRNFHGKQEVVFLQHGLLSAASDWVINMPNESLGYILADLGYDVWLGNTRGNTYSRRHIKLTPKMKEFWDYSFAEMAEYDHPAMIDFILNKTGQEKLSYIGHSQGTTSPFAMLSDKTEYNDKLKIFIALGPVTTCGYITSPIKYLAPFTKEIDFLASLIGIDEFLPNGPFMKFLSEYVCDEPIRWICSDIVFAMFGVDLPELNETRMGVYAAHTPAGSSAKSVAHYGQLVESGKFNKYDYGKKENLVRYGQETPPEYDLTKITTPVALMWGLNDDLADP